ncbi:MAG TPA: SpoIID/LytB domain-containing protein [Actinomycetota bacterium]|nr:SpoIID/LytB domain-containing protein [Actinomycetota bacterium]
MRARLVGIMVVVALFPLGGSASANTTFTFHGSGWGHGIGLSQYGAFGLAQEGWSANRILKHYYSGTSVAEMSPPAKHFRIGLVQSRSAVTIEAVGGRMRLTLTSGKVIETVPSGGRRRIERTDGRFRVGAPGTTGRLWGSSGDALRVTRLDGGSIHLAEWGHTLNRGRLELAGASSSRLHAVAIIGPQAYLYGIAEVPSSWPGATLQAQAIAARTYAFRKVASTPGQRRSDCACALVASTRDQYFIGREKELGPMGDRWVAAVRDTVGRVVRHNGNLITTYYSSSSGGFTENVENVWSGAAATPYLKAVCDPGDFLASNPNRTWSADFSDATLTSRLRSLTGSIGTITRFTEYRLGISGRVKTVKVVGTSGSKVVKGWDLRSALGLKDTRFRVGKNLNVVGKIREAYDEQMCAPGRATSAQRSIAGGRFQEFQRGRMYLNDATAAVTWLRGPVLDAYLARDAHAGSLGLPRSLTRLADGGWRGRFDGGTIECSAGGTCSVS